MEKTAYRKPTSVKTFNEYINKVIKVYHETGQFKGQELGAEYGCCRIPESYLKQMGLVSIDRPLTITETEAIYRYRRNTNSEPLPVFGEAAISEELDDTLTYNLPIEVKGISEETAPTTPTNPFANIIAKAKYAIASLFKRTRATGFYVQGKQEGDTTTFVWNNNKMKKDFVLVLHKNRVIECRRVEEDDVLNNEEFGAINIKQVFRVVSFMKYEYDKLEQENKVLRAKIDAIAQILLIANEKVDPKTKKEPNLFGEYE